LDSLEFELSNLGKRENYPTGSPLETGGKLGF